MSVLKGSGPGLHRRRLSLGLPGMGASGPTYPWAGIQWADIDVGGIQWSPNGISRGGRLPMGEADMVVPASRSLVPRWRYSRDKRYLPSLEHVRADVRFQRRRRACAAVWSPPGRPVPSGGLSGGLSEGVSADRKYVGRRCRGYKAWSMQRSHGHSSLLLSVRVSPCNLALPVYKGGQGLLCEGRPIP